MDNCKVFVAIIFLAVIALIPISVTYAENSQDLSSLNIVCYAEDLFEYDDIIRSSLFSFKSNHSEAIINVDIKEPTDIQAMGDIYLVHHNFRASEPQPSVLSFTKAHNVNMMQNALQFNDWRNELFQMDYIFPCNSKVFSVPITVVSTVMSVNEEIWKELSEDISNNVYPNTWFDFLSILNWVNEKENYTVIADYNESGIPMIMYQICAYIQQCKYLKVSPDYKKVEKSLNAYRELILCNKINTSPEDERIPLFTIQAPLYLSGDEKYVSLPALSDDLRIIPASCVSVFVDKSCVSIELAYEFVDYLLAYENQSVYNLMGVIRKDISTIPTADYEAFAPPTENNNRVYIEALKYAAIPELNKEEKEACISLFESWSVKSIDNNRLFDEMVYTLKGVAN